MRFPIGFPRGPDLKPSGYGREVVGVVADARLGISRGLGLAEADKGAFGGVKYCPSNSWPQKDDIVSRRTKPVQARPDLHVRKRWMCSW